MQQMQQMRLQQQMRYWPSIVVAVVGVRLLPGSEGSYVAVEVLELLYCETYSLYCEVVSLYCEVVSLYCETDSLYCETDSLYCETDSLYLCETDSLLHVAVYLHNCC